MERHSFSVNYNVSRDKMRKDGSIPIHTTITMNGLRAAFATGKKVDLENWDNIRQRVKGTNEEAKLTNAFLDQIKIKIAKSELLLLERRYVITAELFKDAYFNIVESIQTNTLIQVYQDYITLGKDGLTKLHSVQNLDFKFDLRLRDEC